MLIAAMRTASERVSQPNSWRPRVTCSALSAYANARVWESPVGSVRTLLARLNEKRTRDPKGRIDREGEVFRRCRHSSYVIMHEVLTSAV